MELISKLPEGTPFTSAHSMYIYMCVCSLKFMLCAYKVLRSIYPIMDRRESFIIIIMIRIYKSNLRFYTKFEKFRNEWVPISFDHCRFLFAKIFLAWFLIFFS